MFTHKRKKPDLVFWIFGFIALGIIISFSVLVFMLFTKVGTSSNSKSQTDVVDEVEAPALPSLTTEELKGEYNEAVEEIVSELGADENGSIDDILLRVENKLLSVRVPKEMKEDHLNVVLSIVRLRAEVSKSPDEVHSKLLELLKNLHIN
ncbi:hypothetical protein HOF40_01585 [Candidatus Parcubacteria bacterium]|jgi:hypothetical protein|nr:hypothetical protein [Candidatus Parcubacteria bacterium]MBT3948757.1 hypothetical protein [Candidatus Parcubacteria bacterium]